MALEQCPQRDGPFEGTAGRLQPKKLDWAVRHVSSVLISIQFVIHVARLSEISNRARTTAVFWRAAVLFLSM